MKKGKYVNLFLLFMNIILSFFSKKSLQLLYIYTFIFLIEIENYNFFNILFFYRN